MLAFTHPIRWSSGMRPRLEYSWGCGDPCPQEADLQVGNTERTHIGTDAHRELETAAAGLRLDSSQPSLHMLRPKQAGRAGGAGSTSTMPHSALGSGEGASPGRPPRDSAFSCPRRPPRMHQCTAAPSGDHTQQATVSIRKDTRTSESGVNPDFLTLHLCVTLGK